MLGQTRATTLIHRIHGCNFSDSKKRRKLIPLKKIDNIQPIMCMHNHVNDTYLNTTKIYSQFAYDCKYITLPHIAPTMNGHNRCSVGWAGLGSSKWTQLPTNIMSTVEPLTGMQSDPLLKRMPWKMSNGKIADSPSYVEGKSADLQGVVNGCVWRPAHDQVGVADCSHFVDVVAVDALVKQTAQY